ncbi:MAG: DUF483 domain-containing protein [Elusimicrobiales bacterium]|nr:DUF483 domain-containing protein [Elusimicrobiales bacterium]
MPLLKLKKPFGRLTALRDCDPGLSDLAALLIGAKPVLYTDFEPAGWDYVRVLCAELKLHYVFPEELYGAKGFKAVPASGKRMLLIGRRLKDLKLAAESWHRSPTDPAWGVLLGYPECCVKAYIAWRAVAETTDLVDFILANTADRGRLDFTLNNVFNYFSRLTGTPADRAAFDRLRARNKALDIAALQIISWHPCSYNCARSAQLGREIFRFFEEYLPARALQLKETLARPLLFGGKYSYAVLNGTGSGDEVRYSGLLPPRSLLPAPAARVLERCGSLAAAGGAALAWRTDSGPREKVPGRFELLNFTAKKRG